MKTFLGIGASLAVVLLISVALATLPARANSTITNFSAGQTTTCVLDAGTPSQCDMTITSGAKCVTSLEGTSAAVAALGTANSYPVATTLRVTSADSATATVRAVCNK